MAKNIDSGIRAGRVAGWVATCAVAALALTACTSDGGQGDNAVGAVPTIEATEFVKIAEPHENSALGEIKSLAEGSVFGPDGGLYVTDVAAPGGEPKILKLDLDTKEWTTIYTDQDGVYSSAQFSPKDGKLYVTDMGGKILRMNPDGSTVETVFDGPVDGRRIVADDIAFDAAGSMYITDFAGTPWDPTGRLIRIDSTGGVPTVLQEGLASPNGISFTNDYSRLWVNETTANRLSNFRLNEDGSSIIDGRVGIYVNLGTKSGGDTTMSIDSIAVDSEGNIYQTVYGGGEILIWNSVGDLLATVITKSESSIPQLGITNIAIKPGTKDAFATVGAENGSYVYQFEALGEGIG